MEKGPGAMLPGFFCCHNAAFLKGGFKGGMNIAPAQKSFRNMRLCREMEAGTGIEPVYSDLQSGA